MQDETTGPVMPFARMTNTPNLRGTLFIVTYGRSGSTLLQNILHTIPQAHIRGENGAVLHGLFQAAGNLRRVQREREGMVHGLSDPWYGLEEADADDFEREMAAGFVRTVLHPPQDARWIGFKEVRYPGLGDRLPAFLDFCRRAFPNAMFVFNSRDAEAVRQSKWWASKPAETVRNMVHEADRRFAGYARKNPQCSYHVRYEETVADPASLRPLFEKLGEPFDAAKVDEVMARRVSY